MKAHSHFRFKVLGCWLAGALSIASLQAQVTLPRLVSDGMVLQRNQPIHLWGWASPGEQVTISFNNQTYIARADNDKNWEMSLPPMKEGGPYTMNIKASNEINLKDILIGDVWLCSGQSNMEYQLYKSKDRYAAEIATSANPMIHEFDVKQRYSFFPVTDIEGGQWKPANPGNVPWFTAVGYFFGRALYDQYKVPIGILHCSWPGSNAEGWISREGLKEYPQYLEQATLFSDTTYANGLLRKDQAVSDAWYKNIRDNDQGIMGNLSVWANNHYTDTADWKLITVPGFWESQGPGNIDGVVWFKKTIDVPAAMAGKDAFLELGIIDDIDTTWFNGQRIGYTNNKYSLRKYKIPASLLQAGKNVITIRIIDNEGNGGVIPGKTYRLVSADGSTSIPVTGEWKFKVGYASQPLPVQSFTRIYYKPTTEFYGMLQPITGYGIKGALWYQGEANASKGRAYEYRKLLPTMIREWRSLFKQGDFPFLIVQLANFMQAPQQPQESNWAMLRESQSVVAATEPNCGLAVAIDIGEANDIHPTNKKEVSRRLALVAEKMAYHDNKVVAAGPTYQSMRVKDNTIILSFTNIGKGLVAKNGALKQFAIAGADKHFVWATARIEGSKVIVSAKEVANPVAVRYAWADNPEGSNLYNEEDLPASPFRTDEW